MGRASPIEDPEACIYGYGAVRFLTNALVSSSIPSPKMCNGTVGSGAANANTHKTLGCRLARHGVIPLMILHLKMINEAVSDLLDNHNDCFSLSCHSLIVQGATAKLSGPPLHALYQLSGAFRALSQVPLSDFQSAAGDNSHHDSGQQPNDTAKYSQSRLNRTDDKSNTTESNQNTVNNSFPMIREMEDDDALDNQLDLAGPHLIRSAEICIGEIEVQTNIIRTLSVLSEQDKCCDAIAEMSARLGILLGPGPMPPSHPKINTNKAVPVIPEKTLGVLSRIGYILGNIMARSDSARVQFYNNDVAMEYLLANLEVYSTERFTWRRASVDGSLNENDTVVDVVIKLIRVIANMSVNPEVGYGLANYQPLGSVLLSLLLTINKFKFNFVSVFSFFTFHIRVI